MLSLATHTLTIGKQDVKRAGGCLRYLTGCRCPQCRQAQRRQVARVSGFNIGLDRYKRGQRCVECCMPLPRASAACPRCGVGQVAGLRRRLVIERKLANSHSNSNNLNIPKERGK